MSFGDQVHIRHTIWIKLCHYRCSSTHMSSHDLDRVIDLDCIIVAGQRTARCFAAHDHTQSHERLRSCMIHTSVLALKSISSWATRWETYCCARRRETQRYSARQDHAICAAQSTILSEFRRHSARCCERSNHRSHREGQGFDSPQLHQITVVGPSRGRSRDDTLCG